MSANKNWHCIGQTFQQTFTPYTADKISRVELIITYKLKINIFYETIRDKFIEGAKKIPFLFL